MRTECLRDLPVNFTAACKLTGFPPNKVLEEALTWPQPPPTPDGKEVAIDYSTLKVRAPLGPPNVRALCAALLARGTGLAGKPYRFLKHLILREADVRDSGAAALGEVLRNGALVSLELESLTLLACAVGVEGALSLGSSLMLGACTSLHSLNLDLNPGLGDAGVKALCKGLLTNRTLTHLSLAGCGLGAEACLELGGFLNSPTCVLQHLDVQGNGDVGLEGLNSLAVAACYSRTLGELVLCNCGMSSRSAADKAALAMARLMVGGVGGGRTQAAPSSSSGSSSSSSGSSSSSSVISGSSSSSSGGGAIAAGKESGGAESKDEPPTLGEIAFGALGRALTSTECALGRVDLDGNPLTVEDVGVLIPFLAAAPPKVTLFRVPTTLAPEHFTALHKNVVAKGKKGGKKK